MFMYSSGTTGLTSQHAMLCSMQQARTKSDVTRSAEHDSKKTN